MSSTTSSKDVRDLGRKAKARLEEERSKRREIKRIDDRVIAEQQKPASSSLFIPKRKKNPPQQRPSKRRHRAKDTTENDTVDRWVPDVSHLIELQEQSNHKSSTIIQLHGVPTTATVPAIRQFLSGLEPFSIWLVLFPVNTHIPNLDANRTQQKQPTVPRTSIRILVQHANAGAATLATQRSGEIMASLARVAVTQPQDRVAQYLVQHLAVKWNTKKTDSAVVMDTTTTVEAMGSQIRAELDASVPEILWSAAESELRGLLGRLEQNQSPFLVNLHRKRLADADRERLEQQKRRFTEEIERLRSTLPIVAEDASLCDPIISLTQSSIRVLERDVAKIQHALMISSKWESLLSIVAAKQN